MSSLSLTLYSPKQDVVGQEEIGSEITEISITYTIQLLIQLVNKLPTDEQGWTSWINQFQTLCIQWVCASQFDIQPLFERFIPSLADALFLPCFVYLWFSLSAQQHILLHSCFSTLATAQIPHSVAIVFISMQMSIMDLDPKSVYAFDHMEFPFPFDFIIHLCSMLHFDDSGIRLANTVVQNPVIDTLDINGIMKDCITMSNRSSITELPVFSSLMFIKEYSQQT